MPCLACEKIFGIIIVLDIYAYKYIYTLMHDDDQQNSNTIEENK